MVPPSRPVTGRPRSGTPLPSGGSLWARRAAPPPRAALAGARHAEAVVIGGGFSGASAALALAEGGRDVVLLEAETIGHGGSGRNVGLVNAGLWLPPDEVVRRLGARVGEHLNAALAGAPARVFELIARHGIDCQARRDGTLHCAHGAGGVADLQARLAQQRARGAPVRWIDATECARRTGAAGFHGALFDARAGTIDPLAYVRGLAVAAERGGARLFEGSPVVGIDRAGDDWRVRTAGGEVRARWLIAATNAYDRHGCGGHDRRFVVMHYVQFATDPLPPALRAAILPGGEGCWDTAPLMSSFRLDAAGRMVVGTVGALHGLGARVHPRWAARMLAGRFPALAGLPLSVAWHGRIATTTDHLPRIASPGPRALSLFGYGGRGIGPGTTFGTAAARWVLGDGDPAALPLPVSPEPAVAFAGLRSRAIDLGAALVHAVRT